MKERFRAFVEKDGCRSAEPVKNAKCMGCDAVKVKKRRVKLHCVDGTHRSTIVDIVRKCSEV